jgi:hypothetical protein
MTLKPLFAALMLGALSAATGLHASGSIGGSAPRAQGGKAYTMGKSVYIKKIACSQCKVPGGVSNASDAQVLVKRIEANEFSLTSQEQLDVGKYLARRFKLN